jgi:hypothetical protein
MGLAGLSAPAATILALAPGYSGPAVYFGLATLLGIGGIVGPDRLERHRNTRQNRADVRALRRGAGAELLKDVQFSAEDAVLALERIRSASREKLSFLEEPTQGADGITRVSLLGPRATVDAAIRLMPGGMSSKALPRCRPTASVFEPPRWIPIRYSIGGSSPPRTRFTQARQTRGHRMSFEIKALRVESPTHRDARRTTLHRRGLVAGMISAATGSYGTVVSLVALNGPHGTSDWKLAALGSGLGWGAAAASWVSVWLPNHRALRRNTAQSRADVQTLQYGEGVETLRALSCSYEDAASRLSQIQAASGDRLQILGEVRPGADGITRVEMVGPREVVDAATRLIPAGDEFTTDAGTSADGKLIEAETRDPADIQRRRNQIAQSTADASDASFARLDERVWNEQLS